MSKQRLEILKQKVEQVNKELKEIYSESIKEYAKEILDNTRVAGFGWTQYTPYFNDGDPCEFGISIDEPYLKLGNEWAHSYDITEYGRDEQGKVIRYDDGNKFIRDEYKAFITMEELNEILDKINTFASDALCPFEKQAQALLGEGKVLVTKEGIEVEDYDHD